MKTSRTALSLTNCLFVAIVFALSLSVVKLHASGFLLGTSELVVESSAGTNSVLIAAEQGTDPWSASANVSWLHLDSANQSGTGSTNVIFTFDGNTGPTRSGTLTIGGQTLSITQVGSTYVKSTLPPQPYGPTNFHNARINFDTNNDIYFFDFPNDSLPLNYWSVADGSTTTILTMPVVFGGFGGDSLVVDQNGFIYFTGSTSTGPGEIRLVDPTNHSVSTILSNLFYPGALTLDRKGNLFFIDGQRVTNDNVISTQYFLERLQLGTTNKETLYNIPSGTSFYICSDLIGNVYFGEPNSNRIMKWSSGSGVVAPLITNVPFPLGVAVDGSGNLYFTELGAGLVKKWSPVTHATTTLASEGDNTVALDKSGNIYLQPNTVVKLVNAFIDISGRTENALAGTDQLPPILPVPQYMTNAFAPTSSQPWLTVTGTSNGVVSFSFDANTTGAPRTAYINVLGQNVPVTQGTNVSCGVQLATSELVVESAAGTNSILIAAQQETDPWSATANASWLHLDSANQSGIGSTNVVFTFDANAGATRSGTLTIGGQTLTITQVGVTYVRSILPPQPYGPTNVNSRFALDRTNNIYFIDRASNAIKRWNFVDGSTATVAITPISSGDSLTVEENGAVYFIDFTNLVGAGEIRRFDPTPNVVSTIVSNLYIPRDLTLDRKGNLYFIDGTPVPNDEDQYLLERLQSGTGIKETLANISIGGSYYLCSDFIGNAYFGEWRGERIMKWMSGTGVVDPLISYVASGPQGPCGVAVDSSGNVYFSDLSNGLLRKLSPLNHDITSIASGSISKVAVDKSGNIYFQDTTIFKLVNAFVDVSGRTENALAGRDQLPPILPVPQHMKNAFAPTSSQPWLTVTGVTNGVVSFSFDANTTGAPRTAYINVLGQNVPVTQGTNIPPVLSNTTLLSDGRFRFSFSGDGSADFTILATTNLAIPLDQWSVVGTATNAGNGTFSFTAVPGSGSQFFRVRSP